MGEQLTILNGISIIVLILIVTIFVKFLTEITSNIKITDMAKSGFWVNIISVGLIVLASYYFLPLVWGLDLMS